MSGKIQLTPEELKSQSAEMIALNEEMSSLFGGISREMITVNSNWSENLANNFSGKIDSVNASFSDLSAMFGLGAEAALTSAKSMETVDSALKAMMYNSSDAGRGSGGGGGGIRGDDENGFWAEQWDQLKSEWQELGESYKWLEDKYDELPEWMREDFENAAGGDAKGAIAIFGDLLKGDLTWDTLETYLDTVGVENLELSAILNTAKTVVTPEGTMADLMQKMDDYQSSGVDAILEGNIGDGLKDLGLSLACGFGAIGYGVGEVSTEIVSGVVQSVLGKGNKVVDIIESIVPGKAGEVISDAGDVAQTYTDKLVNWISGLL